jgi:hypothetical protein
MYAGQRCVYCTVLRACFYFYYDQPLEITRADRVEAHYLEGGWTEYERGVMLRAGFTPFALGSRTFATDVACIALVAAVRERTASW